MCRIPNLETAVEYCKSLNVVPTFKDTGNHIKFYVLGVRIMISRKKSNPDKVRRDINRVINRA